MQAKLFMIPWIWILSYSVNCQQPSQPNSPSAQTLAGDLLVDAHHRQFYEMLRRQQQINDALLLNNVLLHPHIPQLHIPPTPEGLIQPPQLAQHPGLFNPFVAPQLQPDASTSKLGEYDKLGTTTVAPIQSEDLETVRKSLAGVKTVSIQRKGEVEKDEEKTIPTTTTEAPTTPSTTEAPTTTNTIAPIGSTTVKPVVAATPSDSEDLKTEDLEMVQLFKKLNLSKEETKSIVEHVEQVVREELARKLKEAETSHSSAAPLPSSPSTTTPTPTTTTELTTTTPEPTTKTTTTPSTTTTTEATTTTTASTTTTTTEAPTTTAATTVHPVRIHHPILRVRSEDDLVIHRNNLKHHPIKHVVKKLPEVLQSSEEVSQGSIKTSLKHLPIIVTNDEDDKEVLQKATLHKRVLIASLDKEKESDRDLLVDFATGAPLDLTDHDLLLRKELPISPNAAANQTPAPSLPLSVHQAPVRTTLPPRYQHHELTNFEKLATDYRRRLENTGDINKILQKISENAYISLVERGGRQKLFRP